MEVFMTTVDPTAIGTQPPALEGTASPALAAPTAKPVETNFSKASTLKKVIYCACALLGPVALAVAIYFPICIFTAYRCWPVLSPFFSSHNAAGFVAGCIGAVTGAVPFGATALLWKRFVERPVYDKLFGKEQAQKV